MAELSLQPSIATDLRSQALLQLVNRLSALDLTPILVYRSGSLVDSAVLAMAWQWDVLNPLLLPVAAELATLDYASWDAIANVDTLTDVDLQQFLSSLEVPTPVPLSVLYAQYRALILLSTQLHSIMGTPAALRQALDGLGYSGAIIQEGQNTWGGTQYPSNQGWAVFRILINLLTAPTDTDFDTLPARITAIANFWKPARCWLDSVQFSVPITDVLLPAVTDFLINAFGQVDFLTPAPSDFIVAPGWNVSDALTLSPFYNDRYYFGSNVTYGGTQPTVADGPMVVNGTAVE